MMKHCDDLYDCLTESLGMSPEFADVYSRQLKKMYWHTRKFCTFISAFCQAVETMMEFLKVAAMFYIINLFRLSAIL